MKIMDNLNNRNQIINYYQLIKYCILGVCSMHIIGIIYNCIQTLFANQTEIFLYNVAKYSFGKFVYHLLMITPIALLIRIINNKRYQR